MLSRTLLTLFTVILFVSCEKAFRFSPHEIRLQENERDLNNKNIQKLRSSSTGGAFKFVVTGDSQRFYDELEDFTTHLNQRNDVSFVILNGDISDFGMLNEFQWVNDRLRNLNVPYIGVIGNHDMLGNGRLIFRQMFGEDDFTFSYNGSKFVCLNTNTHERGNDGSLPDTAFLNRELSDLKNHNNAFVIGHMAPFDGNFDPKLSGAYAKALSDCGKVRMSIHAHTHNFSYGHPYGDNVDYLVTASMNKRSYVVVSVNNETASFEQVFY